VDRSQTECTLYIRGPAIGDPYIVLDTRGEPRIEKQAPAKETEKFTREMVRLFVAAHVNACSVTKNE
jgi:hypothetical protein